jgi:DNA-directed RNA polymerase specialized sigma24 family protein
MRGSATKTDTEILIDEHRTSNRLLAVLAIRGMEQPKAIALLDSLGFEPKQIAAAIGITPNAVSIALHRMRKATEPQSAKPESRESIDGIA